MKEEIKQAREEAKAEAVLTEEKPDLIEQARMTAERIEAANKRTEELLAKQEQMLSRAMISGKSLAGEPQKKAEETPAEYAKRVMSGKS